MWTGDDGLKTEYYMPAVHHNSLVDGFALPSLQMLLTGFLSGLAVAVLAALAGHAAWWRYGAGVFTVVMLFSWLYYRRGWERRLELMMGIEELPAGTPETPAVVPAPHIRVDVIEEDGRGGQFIDLPSPGKLPALAQSVLAGRTFSQTAWVNSGVFTRGEYDRLVAALVRGGLAAWRNAEHHNAGLTLTASGRAVFRRLAGGELLPPLPDGTRR